MPDAWIPVSERLPEVDENVLVVNCKDSPANLFIMRISANGTWARHDQWDGGGWTCDGLPVDSYTHWQPLPPPPEVKG